MPQNFRQVIMRKARARMKSRTIGENPRLYRQRAPLLVAYFAIGISEYTAQVATVSSGSRSCMLLYRPDSWPQTTRREHEVDRLLLRKERLESLQRRSGWLILHQCVVKADSTADEALSGVLEKVWQCAAYLYERSVELQATGHLASEWTSCSLFIWL